MSDIRNQFKDDVEMEILGELVPSASVKVTLKQIMLHFDTALNSIAGEVDKQNEGLPVAEYEEGFDYGMKVAAKLIRAQTK